MNGTQHALLEYAAWCHVIEHCYCPLAQLDFLANVLLVSFVEALVASQSSLQIQICYSHVINAVSFC